MLGIKEDKSPISMEALVKCLKEVLQDKPQEVIQSFKKDFPILYSYIEKV